jgi:hypothetical protein
MADKLIIVEWSPQKHQQKKRKIMTTEVSEDTGAPGLYL